MRLPGGRRRAAFPPTPAERQIRFVIRSARAGAWLFVHRHGVALALHLSALVVLSALAAFGAVRAEATWGSIVLFVAGVPALALLLRLPARARRYLAFRRQLRRLIVRPAAPFPPAGLPAESAPGAIDAAGYVSREEPER